MLIWDGLSPWIKDGVLVVLQPEFDSPQGGRFVIATKDVQRALYGSWQEPELQERFARARQVIDSFISNLRVAARFPPSKSVKAHLALLDPGSEDVWEFRSPKPGVRVFGRFAAHNVFVALNFELRENIDDDFTKQKEECKRQWRRLLSPYEPHRGTKLSDYLDNFYEV